MLAERHFHLSSSWVNAFQPNFHQAAKPVAPPPTQRSVLICLLPYSLFCTFHVQCNSRPSAFRKVQSLVRCTCVSCGGVSEDSPMRELPHWMCTTPSHWSGQTHRRKSAKRPDSLLLPDSVGCELLVASHPSLPTALPASHPPDTKPETAVLDTWSVGPQAHNLGH